MTEQNRTDVVVVGAGIVGASCAFHLARSGLGVTVLDAFDSYAEGGSGRSFASVRAQWADPLNIELSWRSIQAYRDFEQSHGFDVGYRASGYLLLVPQRAWADHLKAVELQRANGVPVEVLDVVAAQAITPFAADGIAGATWGRPTVSLIRIWPRVPI
jgi:sarcosine oxidase subunit beta